MFTLLILTSLIVFTSALIERKVLYIDYKINYNDVSSDIIHAIDLGFTHIILAFWTIDHVFDASFAWQLMPTEKKNNVLEYIHTRNAFLMVSAGGATEHFQDIVHDNIISGKEYAELISTWARDNQMDGIDFDFEAEPGDSSVFTQGNGVEWITECSLTTRQIMGNEFIISHAPQAPYFGSWANDAFRTIYINDPSIDFFNIQFYNQGSCSLYNTFETLFINSGKCMPNTSVKEISSDIPLNKLVVGKYTLTNGFSGYIEPKELYSFTKQANKELGWNAGIMLWQYEKNDELLNWSLQFKPQYVFLTNDDAISVITFPPWDKILTNRTNPNGCPITATFFVSVSQQGTSQILTDPDLVKNLYQRGNEIAIHTFNHVATPPKEEILKTQLWLHENAEIPFSEMVGFRAPFLKYDTETFKHLEQLGFMYDSSQTTYDINAKPYSLENGFQYPCSGGTCKGSFNLDEFIMSGMKDLDDTKLNIMDFYTENDIGQVLMENFNKHYNGNRTPFGVYLHAAWFLLNENNPRGFENFLDKILELDDVFIINMKDYYTFNPNQKCNKTITKPTCLQPMGGCKHGDFVDCECKCTPQWCRNSNGVCILPSEHLVDGEWKCEKPKLCEPQIMQVTQTVTLRPTATVTATATVTLLVNTSNASKYSISYFTLLLLFIF